MGLADNITQLLRDKIRRYHEFRKRLIDEKRPAREIEYVEKHIKMLEELIEGQKRERPF